MRKTLLLSLMVLAVVGTLAGGGLFAHFSDTEQSTNNTFTAGKLDLRIDVGKDQYGNPIWYNGDPFPVFDEVLENIKPETNVAKTISVHLTEGSIDASVMMSFQITEDNDNGIVEPESAAGDITDGAGNGELDTMMNVTIWDDADGDSVIDVGETTIYYDGPATGMISGVDLGVMHACVPKYVGIKILFTQPGNVNIAMTDSWGFSVKVDANQFPLP